ncbi:redoxin domain-containing protein [Pseudochryseolinea flava]|uniref:Thioredoxin family protein n=1 Tax=Pseudochryseolinea flava TaxID=2059302 RepID=A0A364XYM4_9BACT|nr:redoxin domain-containing protein [Pseudochryseolinea flava]RAV99421.1 thioredoxin family protein [Pseudochryseolinea flava]
MKRIVLLYLLAISFQLSAQKVVENFTLTNALTGEKISLSTYPSCAGMVIIFTSNSCPYDEYYRARIQKLVSDYHDNVPVLLVNSLVDGNESVEQMKKKAQQSGISTPYLADKDQTLMQQLGATKTPHAFLLKNSGGKFTVIYSGSIDDNAQVEGDVHHTYLKNAITAMLANQSIDAADVRPVGCTIRKK